MKYLILRFSSMGDVILATSLVKNLKDQDSSAEIDFFTKEQYAPLLYNNPNIDNIITKYSILKRYDVIIDIHNNIRSNIYKYIILAKNRITYNKASYARRLFLNSGIYSEILDETVIDRYVNTLSKLNLVPVYLPPEIYLTETEKELIQPLLPSRDFIIISPGAKWATKRWTQENYISLAVKIIRDLDHDVVLTGSEEDMDLTAEIKKGVGTLKRHVVDLSGQVDLRQLAACINASKLVVTPDSGPLHMAWALSTKVVALYGPTVKEFGFQPKDDNVVIVEKKMQCRPCSLHGTEKCKFRDVACMKRIEVHEVMDAIKDIL